MLVHPTLQNFVEVIVVVVPTLLSVAFITIIERKVIGSIQRRIGPNVVGYYGTIQPFADALKLVVKEQVVPSQSTKSLFFLAPILSLVFSLLGWGVIPFGAGLAISDYSIGVLYSLALSSIGIYGVLFAGWSANSKYAFLGSLRATAQIISYELVYTTAVLCVVLLAGTFNITILVEIQQSIWYFLPLLPIFVIFLISALAELNRTPFDLVEGESELVAGYITEHSGIIFVFFFLAEYCSIVLMSTFTALLFIGGYLLPELVVNNSIINVQSIILGVKGVIVIFYIVWVRATLPRVRFDQLMVFCWTGILPIAIGLLVLVPSLLVSSNSIAV